MGIDDDAEQPLQHAGGHHFQVGSRVEVLSNEEDLGGVYFSATVLRPPISLRRSAGKNLDRLYVEYHTLLASDDRPDRLREYVDISSVRPSPPSQEVPKRFELNDVVDAYCKDGWWMGVITGVLGGGERLVVTFEKPPDERELRPSALRAHWDWVDGAWAGLQNLSEALFYVGAKVEVSFERDDDCRGAWFPAAIVRDLENGVYLVELNDRNGGSVKVEVDSANVRPCPPILKDRKFGISERVEAFFDFGWWRGFITKKEVKKNEYTVFFEHKHLDKVFDRSALRAYMDWKDGKWFIASNSETASSSEKRRSCSRSGALKKHKGQNEHANQETEPIAVEKIALQDEELVENVTVQEMIEDIGTASSAKKRRSRSRRGVMKKHEGKIEHANQETEPIAVEKTALQDEELMMMVENVTVQEMIEDIETVSSAKKRRSRSRGGVLKKHEGKNEHANQETEPIAVEKTALQDEELMMMVENVTVQEMIEDIETASSWKKRRSRSRRGVLKKHEGKNGHAIQESIAVEKIALQDEELMMMVEDVTFQEMIEDIETPSLVVDSSPVPQSLVSSVLIDESSAAPSELPDCEWPFVKRNAAWKAIESMEVLRRLPQKPHFQPLRRFKETAREGLAIGCMVTFSNVVERSCSLKFSDPKCMVEDVNHTLLDLEKHGFDFGMVRDCVVKMLEAKDKEEKLLHEVKDINGQIDDHKCRKEKIEGEIKVINDHISRLQQQLELAQIAKDNEVQQIAHLQAGLDQAQQGINSVRLKEMRRVNCLKHRKEYG